MLDGVRSPARSLVVAMAVTVALSAATVAALSAPPAHAVENPILGDGTYYSADPAPLVVGDTLYIFAGRDEAGPATNDFVMREWQAFSTTDVSADFSSDAWQHHPALMRPEVVFDWAAAGGAYAGQVVEGLDGRYYWYVPVVEAASTAADKFAIGVAVSDDPLGPYTDAIGAPLVSQTILDNTIQNIDPTVLVDDDGQVYMWWGTFGQLRMVRLAADMVTLQGEVQTVTGLPGFFEAPWVFTRGGYYYLAYAGNNAGPTSECTPAIYHACIAYATATSPTGPWTYRGVILPPVSSTTSHPGIVEFDGEWYLTYHTADAVGGTHFRRSIAIDTVQWDDTQVPARMLPVQTTPVRGVDLTPRRNVAWAATASVSNDPVPTQYWIKSLNDEKIPANPLPPDMWGTWSSNRPAQQWAQYTWDRPVRVDGVQIQFWRDQAPGIGTGVSNPASWTLEYRDMTTGQWAAVPNPSGFPTAHNVLNTVTFDPVTTTQLRATFNGSPSSTTPTTYAAIAVTEWAVLAAPAESVAPVSVQTWVGRQDPPALPSTVSVTYPGGVVLDVPVWWAGIDPAALQTPGTVTVAGLALGSSTPAAATITVDESSPWWGNQALAATATASYTSPGNSVAAVNDDVVPPTADDQSLLWATWPEVGEQWVEYAWDEPVRVSRSEMVFVQDVEDAVAEGVKVPASWRIQYWVDGAWADVPDADAYGTVRDDVNTTTFAPVTTTRLRAVLQAQGAQPEEGSVGIAEWRVLGEDADAVPPVVSLAPSGVAGSDGWFTSPVTVLVAATDDRDTRFTLRTTVDDAAPVEVANTATTSVELTADGTHTVTATATDSWGNTGSASTEVAIDTTGPVVNATVDAEARTVTLEATDALSGVVLVERAVDDLTAWQPYDAPVLVDGERHTVAYRATDAAGNVTAGTVTVPRDPNQPLTGNVARYGTPTASYTSSWNRVTAVNDGLARNTGGDQAAIWGTWTAAPPATRWLRYAWDVPVTIGESAISFWFDSAQGSGAGVAVPQAWVLEYWDAVTQAWVPVPNPSGYPATGSGFDTVTFDAVTTTMLRATFTLSPNAAGTARSAVAVSEWQVQAVDVPDLTAPAVTAAVDGRVVTITATDTESGVELVEYRLDEGAWLTYTGPVTVGDAAVTVWFRAADVAGNTSDVGSVQVPAVVTPVSFSDVPESHPFYEEITWLASEGITRGYADGTFRGMGSVNRDAMAAFLFRLVTGEQSAPACTVAPFSDVAVSHPFCGEIAWLKAQGITGGYADGTYRPGAPVARDAMAAFIYRLVTGEASAPRPAVAPFTDVAVTHPFAGEIAWLKAQGLAQGWPDGTFRPSVSIERQAMAAFLYRLVNETDLMPTGATPTGPFPVVQRARAV